MSMDFLEAVEEQLVAATERGIRRRRWRWPWLMRVKVPLRAPSVGIAAGIGTALAASAIAATVAIPTSKPKAHAVARAGWMGPRSYTTGGAVPAGFQPQSFTAISEYSWWLLGTAPCGTGTCTAIVQTTDGGRTFTRIPAPPTTHITNVRFADSSDGYAFGPQLWTTHDGGRTWSEPSLGASQLAIADGYVYAVATLGGPVATLMRSQVGFDSWTVAPGLAGRQELANQPVGALWVQGPTVIIQAGARLLISGDQGAHFSRRRGVQGAGDCSYDGGPGALWALCSTGMAPDEVLLSHDLGRTFRAAAQVPNGPINSFAAASGSVAVASGQGPLYRTSNGGRTWKPADAPSGGWTYLGFTDRTHGVAIGDFGSGGHQQFQLYYTINAGRSYHLVSFGP